MTTEVANGDTVIDRKSVARENVSQKVANEDVVTTATNRCVRSVNVRCLTVCGIRDYFAAHSSSRGRPSYASLVRVIKVALFVVRIVRHNETEVTKEGESLAVLRIRNISVLEKRVY